MSNISCRVGCGACCIAPSLSSPIPGMPGGKPAGIPCVQLTPDNRCMIYDKPGRPAVCVSFQAMAGHCGSSREEALRLLQELERDTQPENDAIAVAEFSMRNEDKDGR